MQRSAATFALKCAKCHTIGRGDRVGPDLRGVADRHEPDWLVRFVMHPSPFLESDPAARALLERFHGVRMEETHLSREEVEGVLEFIKAVGSGPSVGEGPVAAAEQPLAQKVPMPDEEFAVFWPGVAALLVLLAAAAACRELGFPRAAWPALTLAALAGYWSFGGRRYFHLLGNQQGYEPRQPIAFSHALHAGRLGIGCAYCHYGARRSDVAGVPALSVCMNCHRAVRKTAAQKEPSPEIARLASAWEQRASSSPASIAWVRVHHLPDFVHFSHRVHLADEIQCQECHGPVQTMERVRQAASLSMGWCIGCHREKAGTAPTHWKRIGGPLDCAACHW